MTILWLNSHDFQRDKERNNILIIFFVTLGRLGYQARIRKNKRYSIDAFDSESFRKVPS